MLKKDGKKHVMKPKGGMLKHKTVVGTNRATYKGRLMHFGDDVERANTKTRGRNKGEKAKFFGREKGEGREAKGKQAIM